MPKVKKKSIGGFNPFLLTKLTNLGSEAINFYNSINTLKKQKEGLYDDLMNRIKNGDIKRIGELLETELKKIDDNSSKELKELKPKIEEVKRIYNNIPYEKLEQMQTIIKEILETTNSDQPKEKLKDLLNQGIIQDQSSTENTQKPEYSLLKQMKNTALNANTKLKNKLEKGITELNEKTEGQKTQDERIDEEYKKANNRSDGNPTTGNIDSEHRHLTGVGNSRYDGLNNSSGFALGYSKTPEDIDDSRSMYIIIAIALKGILRYIWNLFVVTVKTSYRVFTDFVLIPFYIFLPYVFDVLAVFIILIMLILVILYFVSGGGSKQTRSPGNPFDSIISGISSAIYNLFDPYLSGVIELKDNLESNATSFVGGIEKLIMDTIDMIKETIIAPILRKFIPNPDINDIDEKDKEKRKKSEGRCDNILEIESKDGRYCYKQLKQRNTTWGDNITIPYKLFEKSDMDNPTADTNYDYYMPNCKIDNNFTDAFIDLDTEDNRRTKFICKI